MRTSDTLTDFVPALLAAHKKFPVIKKDSTGQIGTSRTFPYADLSTVLDAVLPPLLANGLLPVQTIDAETSSLLTRLVHTSGQWIESAYPLALDQPPQALGSAITYGRRYSLLALLSVATDDDDGATATAAAPAKAAPKAAPKTSAEPAPTSNLIPPGCPHCGEAGELQQGKFGPFYGCPNWKAHSDAGLESWRVNLSKWEKDPKSKPLQDRLIAPSFMREPGADDVL